MSSTLPSAPRRPSSWLRRLAWVAVGLLLAIALTLAAAVAWVRAHPVEVTPSRLVGSAAPHFQMPRLRWQGPGAPSDSTSADDWVTPAQYRGRVWLLQGFGAWCRACREEHDTLVALSSRLGVPLVGIDSGDTIDEARAYLGRHRNPYAAVAFDPETRLAAFYDLRAFPQVLVIDARGVVRAAVVGGLDDDEVREKLERALDEVRRGS